MSNVPFVLGVGGKSALSQQGEEWSRMGNVKARMVRCGEGVLSGDHRG